MNEEKCPFKILLWLGYAMGAVGVGYFLWIHKAHVMQYIPYALLLLCPLMHIFGGHGHKCHKENDPKHSH
jgi:hypothetical protein